MSRLPLRLDPVVPSGTSLMRSGVRWLVADGTRCRAGDIVAYCNVGMRGTDPAMKGSLAGEQRDMQVGLALRVPGVLRRNDAASLGGFLDQMQYYHTWHDDESIGELEVEPGAQVEGDVLEHLVFAGHRTADMAEVRTGLFTGWHDRARVWWGRGAGTHGTLMSLGICEQRGIVRGEANAFVELFAGARGPAHVVYYPDDALVPAAPVLLQQMTRTAAENRAIEEDIARTFGSGPAVPAARDWMVLAAIAGALVRSPPTDPLTIVSPAGVETMQVPDAMLLSVHSESSLVMRHKRLGYYLQIHTYRLTETGPAFHAWLRANFEQVRRSPADIARDLAALVDALRARGVREILFLNAVSTLGTEQVQCYAAFDRPLGKSLGSVRAREHNAMLHDLAHSHDVAIVDTDAIAADFGVQQHIPDRVHASGAVQQATREEILRILHARGVQGFAPR